MKENRYNSRILWYEGIGFLIIIAFSWLTEVTDLRNFTGDTPTPINWNQCLVETCIVLLIALPVMFFTRKLLLRLYYLEGFLRICAWCKKLEENGKWIPIETYFKEHFKMESSHGICPECFEKTQKKADPEIN
ncbi:MAG: hypothetical protein JSS81_14860 [Acidobacteria bacterium]|nr:hypothetical protein [Acidobacteriota bacterium]